MNLAAQLEALSALERTEAELLSWGIVDSGFSEDDVLATLQVEVDRHRASISADELLDALLEQRLVVPVPDRPDLYRTRMAETVRLLVRLRQLFPKHSGTGWRNASRLVADFRLALRPRRYPTRDISIDQALSLIEADVVDLPPSTSAALRALLTSRVDPSRAEEFALSTFQVRATASILRGIASSEAGATVITAGTGSGKTLAFYLPVLADIASVVEEALTRSPFTPGTNCSRTSCPRPSSRPGARWRDPGGNEAHSGSAVRSNATQCR